MRDRRELLREGGTGIIIAAGIEIAEAEDVVRVGVGIWHPLPHLLQQRNSSCRLAHAVKGKALHLDGFFIREESSWTAAANSFSASTSLPVRYHGDAEIVMQAFRNRSGCCELLQDREGFFVLALLQQRTLLTERSSSAGGAPP